MRSISLHLPHVARWATNSLCARMMWLRLGMASASSSMLTASRQRAMKFGEHHPFVAGGRFVEVREFEHAGQVGRHKEDDSQLSLPSVCKAFVLCCHRIR